MTSTTDEAGHPDVSDISDLSEGLLSPSRSEDVQHHLEKCAACADVHATLEEIRGLLGSLPDPGPMPADVADRIDAALAAEALPDAGTSAEARVSRETSSVTDRPIGRPHAATGPGRKGRARGRRRRKAALGAVFTAALLGAGALFLHSSGDEKPATTAQDTFSGSSVKKQVTDLLSTQRNRQRDSGTSKPHLGIESQTETPGSAASANTFIQPSVPVPDCVREGINNTGDALAAKTGTYDGKSAYLVVMSVSGDSTKVTAYIVDASCQQADTPGKVLLKQSFKRP